MPRLIQVAEVLLDLLEKTEGPDFNEFREQTEDYVPGYCNALLDVGRELGISFYRNEDLTTGTVKHTFKLEEP